MAGSQTITITLTDEIAALLREETASGQYGDESAVVAEALLRLAERERPLEDWLRDEVAAIYDADDADDSQTMTVDEAEALLRREYEQPAKAL